MSFLDDLNGATDIFQSMAGGDQATRDNLPPAAPQVPLSTRTQQFLNTLLYPMNAAWATLITACQFNPGMYTTEDPPLNMGAEIIEPRGAVPQAQAYLDYAQWVVPYLDCFGNIINGKYTGQDYKNILAFLNVTENDFTDSTSFDTYVKPHLTMAKLRVSRIMGADYPRALIWGASKITYPNPAPPLPADYTNFFKRQFDHVTGNDTGDGNFGTWAAIGGIVVLLLGVGVVYMILRFR